MSGERVVTSGGRDYANAAHVNAVLNKVAPLEMAQGGASGADRLAALWAHEHGVPCRTYTANWAKYGRAAGPIRNRQMLADFKPDLLIAFPGGRGTLNAITIALELDIPILRAEAE